MRWQILYLISCVMARPDLKLPRASCSERHQIMNDCNWCTCTKLGRYFCKTRECTAVDVWGYFTDAIADIDVGMGVHGAWRSTVLACEPNVLYQRDDLACICGDDGTWPAAECRDTFRVLYQVEVSKLATEGQEAHCEPTKLYVVGCNVCLCEPRGKLGACTSRNCDTSATSVFEDLRQSSVMRSLKSVNSIYAQCTSGLNYKMDCGDCVCLRNNRLSCEDGECSSTTEKPKRQKLIIQKTVAERLKLTEPDDSSNENADLKNANELTEPCESGKFYFKVCNICLCLSNRVLVCTTRNCFLEPQNKLSETENINPIKLQAISKPVACPEDYIDCEVGTSFKRKCNICYCYRNTLNTKAIKCSSRLCMSGNTSEEKLTQLENDCVRGTVYETRCKFCKCDVQLGKKWESCSVKPHCRRESSLFHTDISRSNGYCIPGFYYKDDCNNCKCLNDGSSISCTNKNCSLFKEDIVLSNITKSKYIEEAFNLLSKSAVKNVFTSNKTKSHYKLYEDESCDHGKEYTVQCNHCICIKDDSNDHYKVCTRMPCLQNEGGLEFKSAHPCIPGTNYTKGCNTCSCVLRSNIEMEVCSLKRCSEQTDRQDKTGHW